MNKFTLRLTWLSVKAAELLLPVVWNVARWLFWSLVLFLALAIIVIIL